MICKLQLKKKERHFSGAPTFILHPALLVLKAQGQRYMSAALIRFATARQECGIFPFNTTIIPVSGYP
jgi:hypothetical protein